MNAYELADELYKTQFEVSNMLRKQADRIAELEKELYFKNYYEELPDTPVGIYTTPQTKPLSDYDEAEFMRQMILCCGVHPTSADINIIGLQKLIQNIRNSTSQTKPLSDEEIHELANEHLRTKDHDGAKVVLGLEDFARAIEERHGIK